MNKILADKDITTCPECARVVMIVPGQVDLGMKDEKGVPISHDAAIHMSKFRVRCECGINFCVSCNVKPYHVGKTCEELKLHKEAFKCRVCDAEIKNNPNPNIPLAH